MRFKGKNVLITGASMGIGAAIARKAVNGHANVILFARSGDKLKDLAQELQSSATVQGIEAKVYTTVVDVQSYKSVSQAIENVVKCSGSIDILINNAGLALGAPVVFHEQKIEDIDAMVSTNINGMMYTTHAVLNAGGMAAAKRGTIINVTSTTGLEVPPFPSEAVYHTSKAAQEAFTNVLRTELQGTNIKVQALRPGVVSTHFHAQRVGFDRGAYDDFMKGMEPLVAEDVAEAAMMMLMQPERVSIKAMDIVPTAQRTLQVMDRTWNERNSAPSTAG